MATIQDTLREIETLQLTISKYLKDSTIKNCNFVSNLFNFTTIYYFELSAHACLDIFKSSFKKDINPLIKKYYSLSKDKDLLEEYIRWINIGGLFCIWNIFERFIREKEQEIINKKSKYLEDAYEKILKRKGIKGDSYSKMVDEFNAIRYTRNSLHQGGIYSFQGKQELKLGGEKHTFEAGRPVKPIRLMTALDIMWKHFLTIELSK